MVVLEWSVLARLFVSCLTCLTLQRGACGVRTRKQPPGIEIFISTQSVTAGQKVLTIEGRECKFPFRLGGTVYHQCIALSSGRQWCSLTNNFDRDMKWGYCSSQTRLFNTAFHSITEQSLCNPNPCKNGGVCTAVPYQRFL
ncbi:hepatocyte growth factor activator-like [Neoarius graeffei]|uniref:hepatocyte growth factor activator-like n=1 Tax=Neoarius graeffei TaxID=443677 RepID=UPI00298C566F|nr:hepatocyte growth factor activator-like [Neoarius graeffei]